MEGIFEYVKVPYGKLKNRRSAKWDVNPSLGADRTPSSNLLIQTLIC